MDRRKDIAREIARNYIVLSTDGLNRLADILVPMKFRRGELVLKENEVCNYMYYIEKGLVRQFCRKDGKEVTEDLVYENGIVFSAESYFQRVPTRLMIQTLEPSILYGIPYDAIQELTRQSYEFCHLMFVILERSLVLSQRKADSIRFETAKERYLRVLRDCPDIIRRAPLQYVASYLQMTPETLSRVRKATNESNF
ncbi:MAG: Crp/Fnr family transcriptional regulator [Bacteroides sp.]|nr:Crp/Fnr family transcriptional regulator [Roseburia sp.]MCM1346638.1 Crp/Fnr family transcriptional regulator [Bacteroides sp.]MCM1420035.1 Crp/Fnr family transcriptional regulator [Bacteroides sp.]